MSSKIIRLQPFFDFSIRMGVPECSCGANYIRAATVRERVIILGTRFLTVEARQESFGLAINGLNDFVGCFSRVVPGGCRKSQQGSRHHINRGQQDGHDQRSQDFFLMADFEARQAPEKSQHDKEQKERSPQQALSKKHNCRWQIQCPGHVEGNTRVHPF